uniref:Uncharacterized protein n=1 Tax=Ditylenchus dipsaci TaxID=166011 RepID=A0A915EGC0_9BILA
MGTMFGAYQGSIQHALLTPTQMSKLNEIVDYYKDAWKRKNKSDDEWSETDSENEEDEKNEIEPIGGMDVDQYAATFSKPGEWG